MVNIIAVYQCVTVLRVGVPRAKKSLIVIFIVYAKASTQTDAMRVPVSRRRQMKNKSVLCRPFTMDQESMCQLPTTSTESAGNFKNTRRFW